MSELRVGIAGFGVVGKRRYQSILKIPNIKVVVVSDRTFAEDCISQEGFDCLNEYQKIYSYKLDAVFVCLTNDVSADAVIKGLENGIHIFCEKPPGRNLADVARVL